jgi:hypothetical protein
MMRRWQVSLASGERLHHVTGHPDVLSLPLRILNATTFCTMAASGLNFLVDLVTQQPRGVWLVSSTACLVFGLLHVAGRRGLAYGPLSLLFFLSTLLFLGALFVVMGEVAGSPTVAAMALFGIIPILLRGRMRVFALLLLALELGGMAYLQLSKPDLWPAVDPAEALQDTMSTVLLLGAGLAVLVSMVVLSLQREQERVEAASQRLATLNESLEERNRELDAALQEIRALQGIIPICSWCKKVRNDSGYFEAVEAYVSRHSGARFSHTFCPDCVQKHFGNPPPPPGILSR